MSPIVYEIAWYVLVYGIGIASVIGIWLGLGLNVQRVRNRFKHNRQMRLASFNKKWLRYSFMKNYHFLLSSALRRYELEHFSKVVIYQFILFLLVNSILFTVLQDLLLSTVVSFMFFYVLPIAFLYLRHKQRQSALQGELVEVSVVLLQEYQKNHSHMLYALKSVSTMTEGFSSVAYSRLFARMHDDDEMKELAAENFAFQLGHFRGKNLASIILRACKDGIQVTKLLEDLVEDITEFNKRIRDAETEARETALIGYAPIPFLIILHIINDKWLIPDGEAFYYQFQTPQGLKSFLIASIFGIIGMGLALMVKRPKKM